VTQGWLKAQAGKTTALGLNALKTFNMFYASRPHRSQKNLILIYYYKIKNI